MEKDAVDEAVALEQREDREPRHVEPQDQQQGVVAAKPRALGERAAMRQGCGKAAPERHWMRAAPLQGCCLGLHVRADAPVEQGLYRQPLAASEGSPQS